MPGSKEEIIRFISTHKAEFVQKYGVERIGIGGSFARGDAI
jgi:predicted nucleotidyltransferase